MASRTFNQFQGSLEKGVVQLYLDLTFENSTKQTINRGKGIASVERTATTGVFLITLSDNYQRLLNTTFIARNFPYEMSWSDDLTATAKTFKVAIRMANAVPVWPTAGRSALFSFTLSNSTAI